MTAKRPQGFATLTPERRAEIASKGGKASQAKGTAHTWTSEEARIAGAKGGSESWRRRAGAMAVFPKTNDDAA
jgi:general stress protein YciG